MRKLTSLMLVLAAAVAVPATVAQARQVRPVRRVSQTQTEAPALQPIPETQPAGPMPAVGAEPIPAQAAVVTLYPNVDYRDERNIAPCAVPQIVMVKDPCPATCDPCNRCAAPPARCVAVQICVPPCTTCPPKITCRRDGEYVRYDFGKYAVEIRSKRGCVTVDYDA